jgi:hypothetical protein
VGVEFGLSNTTGVLEAISNTMRNYELNLYFGFDVPTGVSIRGSVFLDIMPCTSVCQPKFRRYISPPSSGLKTKRSKIQSRNGQSQSRQDPTLYIRRVLTEVNQNTLSQGIVFRT